MNPNPYPSASFDDNDPEMQAAERWRNAILRLSQTLMAASAERSDLAPILMEAMHNALEQLLVFGHDDELMALEEWLELEAESTNEHLASVEQRSGSERRQGERRTSARRSRESA